MTMLRPLARSSALLGKGRVACLAKANAPAVIAATTRMMATQSSDETQRPTALAKLHLEDGTTLTGRSFGSHEAVEGEVRQSKLSHCLFL